MRSEGGVRLPVCEKRGRFNHVAVHGENVERRLRPVQQCSMSGEQSGTGQGLASAAESDAWSGQHCREIRCAVGPALSTNCAGWVRAVVAGVEKDGGETSDSLKSEATPPWAMNGWQTDLVERMTVVGLGSQEGKESPHNLTLSGGSIDSDDVSPRSASQRLWETGALEAQIPNGFYSVVPSRSLKARFKIIPSFDELKSLGAESANADVLVVDANEDKIVARLMELVVSSVKTTASNPSVVIKKIADIVSDFYGGPVFEAGAFKHPVEELATTSPKFLGQVKVGLCRPRALLFKFLGDAVGLHSRLLMGLQLEAVSSSSLICAHPNKHLSNVVCLNDMELLVDVTRHPGHLIPFSRKALIMYHISGAGDSDSADYDSCDSPLEPNSPLFGYPDRLDGESQDHEFLDSPGRPFQRRQPSPVTAAPIQSLILRLPMGREGKLSPSRSEPDLANPYRRRSRRKAMTEERAAASSPERPVGFQQPIRRSNTEEVRSFPSSPEHPQARLKPIWRVGSEEGSISSSPEYPGFRVRLPSMLGGGRRQGGDEADCNGISSPEQSPQHPSTVEKHSPIFRRRRERSLSIDVTSQRDGLNGDYFRTGGESEFPRVNSSPDIRKTRKKSSAPEVGDDVARAVRAMNEAIKLQRSRSNASSEKQSLERDHCKPSSDQQKITFEQDRSNASSEPHSEGATTQRQSKRSQDQQTQDVVEHDQNKVLLVQLSKDTLERERSKALLEQRSKNTSEQTICPGEHSSSASGLLTWEHTNESRNRAVMVPIQCDRVPRCEESVTRSNEETLERSSDAHILFGVGSSSSENASITDTSSHALTLKPPPWLQLPLMPYSEWNIKFEELRIGGRVGIGSFGEVFRGVWRGTEVAIKVMLEQDFTEENTADFCTEIALLSRLRHPNVILFMGACTIPPHLSMVTEYMHMGSLYSLVHTTGQGKKLSWRRRLKMLRDICRGMMSVQRMNIIHCDLKSANCLVDKHWSVKICDFGLSRLASRAHVPECTAAAGTPEWMAPELLRNDPVTDKCDIFSLGVIMWELCALKRPWEGVKPMEVVIAVAHKQARLDIPEGLLGKLIADCWAEDPVARPTYEEILTRLHECEYLQS